MGLTDKGLHPTVFDDYRIETVDPGWLQERVKPKRHIGLTAELCILCRACEDVCPWECIWMLAPNIVADAESDEVMTLANTAASIFVIDDNECTRCAICVERCPSDALWLGRTSA
ncbi:MAG: 4Fe-4S binding protein [Actinobacteria bacterium]|nr:4Fe-4S binding protein [Actinomycetota bacterium]